MPGKIRIRGKIKGIFFVLGLDQLVPAQPFLFLAHLAKLSKWIRKHSKIRYSDFYTWKFDYSKRYDLFEQVILSQKLDAAIDFLEFGVSTGASFRWWVERIRDPGARFYGFDTFTGLPEDWGPFKKGDMHNENAPPRIDDPRHRFIQGLFQQTLIPFLKEYIPRGRKVIHLDADLYSATLYVLTTLTPVLKPGDIIFFDEFNVPLHEFKAFTEWTRSFHVGYEVIGGVNNFYQVAIMLK